LEVIVDITTVAHEPTLDTREKRALDLYRERGAEIVRTGPHTYLVPSCTGRGAYAVDYAAETCDCPDFTIPHPGREPGEPCKHVYAVGILRAKRRGQSVPEGAPPAHELIRRDAAAHPERLPSEHEAAARRIAAETYREDLARISPAANAALSGELEAEDLGL
jgi:hypothetical protein